MKAIILNSFLLLIVFNAVRAQEASGNYKFGVSISPKVTKQIFDNSETGTGNTIFGIGFSLDYYYKLSEKVGLRTGVTYNFSQIDQIDYSFAFACDINVNDITGFDLSNSWIEDQYKIHYIGIPLEAILKLIGEQNHLYTRFGIEGQLKIASSSNTFLVECRPNRREIDSNPVLELRKMIFQINLGIGFQLKLSTDKDLYIEPQISYTLNEIFKEVLIANNSKRINLGIMMGVKF